MGASFLLLLLLREGRAALAPGLTLYGNELQQATRLWNLTSARFNEAQYFSDFYRCYTNHPRVGGIPRCFGETNERYRPLATLWAHKTDATGRAELDCSYSVEAVQLKHLLRGHLCRLSWGNHFRNIWPECSVSRGLHRG